MKKIISIILIAVFVFTVLTACGGGSEDNVSASANDSSKLKIVTTIFPLYDWVREVLGDNVNNAEITMLLGNGIDLHNYQPTAADILTISTCDLFIYVGGTSDSWADDVLAGAINTDMVVINLLDVLGDSVKEEEQVEGMEDDEEEGDEADYDEHVWLSLKNAEVLCLAIADALSEVDPDNADLYRGNVEAYNEKLSVLDEAYQEVANAAALDTLLFADRFPFRYLVDDYGISYYAAFSGCSAETEASFETIIFLSEKVDELGLTTVLTVEKSDQKIAQTVIDNTENKDQQILTMNSMQSITSDDVAEGVTYLSIMESNLSVFEEALNS